MKPKPHEFTINTPRQKHIWNHAQAKCRGLSGPEFWRCYERAWDEGAKQYDAQEAAR